MNYSYTTIYARVSSTKQDTLSQRPQLEKWAHEHCPNARYLEDVGTGKNMKRASIQKIISDIESGACTRLVVVSINRLGRNTSEVCRFFDLCKTYKCQLISLREGIDLSTPMGKAMANILAALAELENEQRSEATKAGLEAARIRAIQEGRSPRLGGSTPGYSLKVSADKAEAIFALHKAGKSYRAIGAAVGLSDKTVRTVILNPRDEYISRAELARRNRQD